MSIRDKEPKEKRGYVQLLLNTVGVMTARQAMELQVEVKELRRENGLLKFETEALRKNIAPLEQQIATLESANHSLDNKAKIAEAKADRMEIECQSRLDYHQSEKISIAIQELLKMISGNSVGLLDTGDGFENAIDLPQNSLLRGIFFKLNELDNMLAMSIPEYRTWYNRRHAERVVATAGIKAQRNG